MTEAAKLSEREQIARIIDADAFTEPKHPAPDDGLWRGQRKRSALSRADQILALRSSSDPDAVRALADALEAVENYCDKLAATRSQATYDSMLCDGQSDDLIALDDARAKAREAVAEARCPSPAVSFNLSDIERVAVDYFEASDDVLVEFENGEWLLGDNGSGVSVSLTGLAAAILAALTQQKEGGK